MVWLLVLVIDNEGAGGVLVIVHVTSPLSASGKVTEPAYWSTVPALQAYDFA